MFLLWCEDHVRGAYQSKCGGGGGGGGVGFKCSCCGVLTFVVFHVLGDAGQLHFPPVSL